MDAARLQAKIYAGYGKAASRIGYVFDVHRPAAVTNPIVAGNIVQSINAEFKPRAAGFNFEITSDYKQPEFHGLFDATSVNVGDYMVNASHGTYFVIAKLEHSPVLCIECNNTISVARAGCPTGGGGVGAQGYSGFNPATETNIVTSWPASVVYEARGRGTGAGLPLDEVNPYFIILLPAYPGTDIRPSDIITDANSPIRRYIVTASEKSQLGWRIIARHVTA